MNPSLIPLGLIIAYFSNGFVQPPGKAFLAHLPRTTLTERLFEPRDINLHFQLFQGHLTDNLELISLRTNLAHSSLGIAPSPGRESSPPDTARLVSKAAACGILAGLSFK